MEQTLEASSAVTSASARPSRRVSVRRMGRASASVAPIVAVPVPVPVAITITATTTTAAVAVSVSIPISVTVAVSTLVTIVTATSVAPVAFVLSPRVERGRAHIAAIATAAPAVMAAIAPASANA